jgi:hypothetical protein
MPGVADTTLYTCPAGVTAVVKSMTFVNNAGAAQTIVLGINGTANANRIYRTQLAANDGLVLSGLFIVLQPGQSVHAFSGNGSLTCGGSGAELQGVAP